MTRKIRRKKQGPYIAVFLMHREVLTGIAYSSERKKLAEKRKKSRGARKGAIRDRVNTNESKMQERRLRR